MNEIVNANLENSEQKVNVPYWLLATVSDLDGLDFEAPIHGCFITEAGYLGDLYQAAIQPSEIPEIPESTPQNRVYVMLKSITQMYFKPQEVNEPFGSLFTMGNQRSAIPSDFRHHVEMIADMAKRATNVVLRARLSDLCWLLERKRSDMALSAIYTYSEIVQKTDKNELKYRFSDEEGALGSEARDYLLRALSIDRGIGSNKPETLAAKNLVVKLREQAANKLKLVPLHWFSELDLDFKISGAVEIAKELDAVLGYELPNSDGHIVVDLWKLAASAYHIAKMEDDKNRCLSEAAEQWVRKAKTPNMLAMLTSHFLSSAISQLHGIPNKRERRTELQHMLIDAQARISDEMSSFSHDMNIDEIITDTEKRFEEDSFFKKLFIFIHLCESPAPNKLHDEAKKSIKEYPLSSLFGTSHLDREGKIINSTKSGGIGDGGDESAIKNKIYKSEEIRRSLCVSGQIHVARQAIFNQHFISDDALALILQHSPFIPDDLVFTFSKGFTRFFQGDMTSAVYILTPLLENSLRHILKSHGHIVSSFDNATGTQEDKGISQLFDQMRTELDAILSPAIASDIERVFLSKPGPHLRHALAHGLLHDNDPYGADATYGCWLIFRLCLLPLSAHYKEILSMLEGYNI